ncbi:MAG TPA: TIGR02281 family clan AA aspartic protease [Sphingomicrobium sp.]|nr:TIGR02281 family clan AA aspartic protease [Sphingomicrobium sp.]
MTNGFQLGGVYILMAVMLVLGTLISRRGKFVSVLTYTLACASLFASGFILFTFRDNFGLVWQRMQAEVSGRPVQQGREMRVPMAMDGHFWVTGDVDGVKVKFLVDSGATMTTIGRTTAQNAGIEIRETRNQFVRTGNGVVRVAQGRAEHLAIGTIERDNFPMHIADTQDLNVLGMNFLSTLDRWGVEGRWLVMVP